MSDPNIQRMGTYSGTRQSETKTVTEGGKKKVVTAAPIKFGDYSQKAQSHHGERRTRGMSGAVPNGVHGEDYDSDGAELAERRLYERSSMNTVGAAGVPELNEGSMNAAGSSTPTQRRSKNPDDDKKRAMKSVIMKNRNSKEGTKDQAPPQAQAQARAGPIGVPVEQHLDALDDADKMEAVANDLADELDRVHKEKDDHIEENDFLRKTLAVMQVNKEISEDIVEGLKHVRHNVLFTYGCATWMMLLSIAFFAYFVWGLVSNGFIIGMDMFVGSYSYPIYIVAVFIAQYVVAIVVSSLLFYFGHKQTEMNENETDLEQKATKFIQHSDQLGFVCVGLAVVQLFLMIESFWRESWTNGKNCLDCHVFYLFNFITFIVTAMVLFNQVIKLNELISKIPITDTNDFMDQL